MDDCAWDYLEAHNSNGMVTKFFGARARELKQDRLEYKSAGRCRGPRLIPPG